MKSPSPPWRRERGSLLIVSLILALVIAISLVSYLSLATNALKLSIRSSMANEAMNLTEVGLERAMAAFNASSWTGWDAGHVSSTNDKQATFPASGSFALSNGSTGVVKVYVANFNNPSAATITSKAIITPGGINSGTIVKIVVIDSVGNRSLFAKGLVGRNGVTFRGNNPMVDSWDSRFNDDGTARGSPAAYDGGSPPATHGNAHANGSIAAVNVTATDTVNNADIFGTASVGGSSTDLITVGPQGLVGPFGTGNGVKDPNNISANFTANLPTPTAPHPTVTNSLSTLNTTLPDPLGHDNQASDGNYYYVVDSSGLSMNGPATRVLSITGGSTHKVILISADGGNLSIGGSASIQIASGSSLSIYSNGNVTIGGNGVANGNNSTATDSFQIWGTNTTEGGQSITVNGNGSMAATIYAPNANVEADGGGTNGVIYGAIVGNTITMNGNTSFHYDEWLGKQGGANTFAPGKWSEIISAADRSSYVPLMNF